MVLGVKPCASLSLYADQQSLMTVVPGSIQSRRTAINVSVILSGTGTRNVFSGIALNTNDHPLPLHFVSSIVLAPTEPTLVDFGGFVRTANFPIFAQQIVQHNLSTYLGPTSDGCRNVLKLLLDSVSRKAVKVFVREVQNLHKVQIPLLKTSTVSN